MPSQTQDDKPKRGRCRNCKKFFLKTREDKVYCSQKCRDQYNNYGQTPQAQMETRLKAFMRTETFRELLREAMAVEIRKLVIYDAESRECDVIWKY